MNKEPMDSLRRLDINDGKNVSSLSSKLITNQNIRISEGAVNPRTEASFRVEEKKSVERPPLAPFFTLVNTGEITAHPRQVHYLFSDDDTSDVLTSALLRTLFDETTTYTSLITSADRECLNNKNSLAVSDNSSISSDISHRDPAKEKKREQTESKGKEFEREERVIIVDLNSAGDGVTSVSSLSSKWQVLNAQIEKAPTWNGADESNTEDNRDVVENIMLKIEGVANTEIGTHKTLSMGSATGIAPGIKGINPQQTRKDQTDQDIQTLLENFDYKMTVLKRVMGMRPLSDPKDIVVESGVERYIEEK